MSLKIYFCGSIRAGRQDAELYGRLISQLKNYGTVLTEHVGAKELEQSEKTLTDKYIHDRDVDWLKQCDVVVAEVTQPSLGVGYEIGRAVAMDKRILCLFRPEPSKRIGYEIGQAVAMDNRILCLFRPEPRKRLSAMISGADSNDSFIVKNYSEPEASEIFKEFFS